jgi:hypothetical protein
VAHREFGVAFRLTEQVIKGLRVAHAAIKDRGCRGAQVGRPKRPRIGTITISNPGEISYGKQHQKRVARAELKTHLGSEVIYYTVEWQNRSKGIIWVQIQAHP